MSLTRLLHLPFVYSRKMRVRQILSMGGAYQKLRHLIPRAYFKPSNVTRGSYPSALLKAFPPASSNSTPYTVLGTITEYLLRYPEDKITPDALMNVCAIFEVPISPEVAFSASTSLYIESVKQTRVEIEEKLDRNESLQYDEVLEFRTETILVEGHPDIRTKTQVFEVKTSCSLVTDWGGFIAQAFAYASLDSNVERVNIVLPLQSHVESYDVSEWARREEYRDLLATFAVQHNKGPTLMQTLGYAVFSALPIGSHWAREERQSPYSKKIKRRLSLSELINVLPLSEVPYQTFISWNTNIRVSDADIEKCGELITSKGISIYAHAPYLINLCEPGGDEYGIKCLAKTLDIAKRCKFKGVVVHTGKWNTKKKVIKNPLRAMKNFLRKVLPHATEECHLLLETPSGQGSETLTLIDKFMGFIGRMDDPRLGACIDTCHVWASGYDPYEYLERFLASPVKNQLKLIHFNDSRDKKGSKHDRHMPAGGGEIGTMELFECAKLALKNRIDMVRE